jgi:hypothetical protein
MPRVQIAANALSVKRHYIIQTGRQDQQDGMPGRRKTPLPWAFSSIYDHRQVFYRSRPADEKILSIDAGGVRGIVPAIILAEIEARTGEPVSNLFDFFAGTSTGGMLALSLNRPDHSARLRPLCSAVDVERLFHKWVDRVLGNGLSKPDKRLTNNSKPGTEKIVGQAFLKNVGGDVKYGAGNMVWLHPVTRLTTEWFTKHIVHGIPLLAGNPRTDDYRRQAIADAEGRFEFNGLPPGDYYLTCSITWGVPTDIGVIPTGEIAYVKVTVRNGETAKAIVTR